MHNFTKISANYITCVEDGAPSCVFESEATIKLEDTSQIHSNTCQKRWKSLNRPECQKGMLQQVTSHHLSQLASPSLLVYPTRLCPQGRSTLNFLEALQVDREAETSAEGTESWDHKAWRENVRWWYYRKSLVRLAYTTLCLDVAEYIYIYHIYISYIYMPCVCRYRYRWSMCIHTYVYILYIYTCTYTCIYVYMFTCIHVFMYIYICIHTYIHKYIHTYTHTHIDTDTQTHRHTDTHTHIYIYIYMNKYAHTYMYVWRKVTT